MTAGTWKDRWQRLEDGFERLKDRLRPVAHGLQVGFRIFASGLVLFIVWYWFTLSQETFVELQAQGPWVSAIDLSYVGALSIVIVGLALLYLLSGIPLAFAVALFVAGISMETGILGEGLEGYHLIKMGAKLGILIMTPFMMMVANSAAKMTEEESKRMQAVQVERPDWYGPVMDSPRIDPNLFDRSALWFPPALLIVMVVCSTIYAMPSSFLLQSGLVIGCLTYQIFLIRHALLSLVGWQIVSAFTQMFVVFGCLALVFGAEFRLLGQDILLTGAGSLVLLVLGAAALTFAATRNPELGPSLRLQFWLFGSPTLLLVLIALFAIAQHLLGWRDVVMGPW